VRRLAIENLIGCVQNGAVIEPGSSLSQRYSLDFPKEVTLLRAECRPLTDRAAQGRLFGYSIPVKNKFQQADKGLEYAAVPADGTALGPPS
jgi:hypothetical protein